MGKPKRRLPVLQPADTDDEQRPAAQWVAIGAVGTILACIPLVYLVYFWARRSLEAIMPGGGLEALTAATPSQRLRIGMIVIFGSVAALGMGAALGGMLVGRFGGDAGKNEGTFAGVAAGVLLSLVSAVGAVQGGQGMDWLISAVVTTILMGIAGRLGAIVGLRWRR